MTSVGNHDAHEAIDQTPGHPHHAGCDQYAETRCRGTQKIATEPDHKDQPKGPIAKAFKQLQTEGTRIYGGEFAVLREGRPRGLPPGARVISNAATMRAGNLRKGVRATVASAKTRQIAGIATDWLAVESKMRDLARALM